MNKQEIINRLKFQVSNFEDIDNYLLALKSSNDLYVLDLGSCIGAYTSKLRKILYPGFFLSIDISYEFLQIQKNEINHQFGNLYQVTSDATTLPLRSDSFDFIFCRFLLQHVKNPKLVLSEAKRVLKPGGQAIFIDTDDTFDSYAPYFSGLKISKKLSNQYCKYQQANGGDRFIGGKFNQLTEVAGFESEIVYQTIVKVGKELNNVIQKDIIPMYKEDMDQLISKKYITKMEYNQAINNLLEFSSREASKYSCRIYVAYCTKR